MRPMRKRRWTPSCHLSPTYDTEKMRIKRQQSVLLLLQHFAKASGISLPLWDLTEASLDFFKFMSYAHICTEA